MSLKNITEVSLADSGDITDYSQVNLYAEYDGNFVRVSSDEAKKILGSNQKFPVLVSDGTASGNITIKLKAGNKIFYTADNSGKSCDINDDGAASSNPVPAGEWGSSSITGDERSIQIVTESGVKCFITDKDSEKLFDYYADNFGTIISSLKERITNLENSGTGGTSVGTPSVDTTGNLTFSGVQSNTVTIDTNGNLTFGGGN